MMIETSDQHRTANLANSAVLKMLEEQEGERFSVSNERKSRPRHRKVIDRETVLKINRRRPRRDFSWPPQDDTSRSRSISEETCFDENVRKRQEIFHLKEMFNGGAIDENKRNISRTSSLEKTQKISHSNNITERKFPPVYGIKSAISQQEWPPKLSCDDGEPIVDKTFHLPDDELHIGLIEPIRKYFERVVESQGFERNSGITSSLKRWKSYDNVIPKSMSEQRSIKRKNNQPVLERYKSSSYNELPPLKPPRRESNNTPLPTKEKLNLNNSGEALENGQGNDGGKFKTELKVARIAETGTSGGKKIIRFQDQGGPSSSSIEAPASGANSTAENKPGTRNRARSATNLIVFSNDHEDRNDVTLAAKNRQPTIKRNISGLSDLQRSKEERTSDRGIKCITVPSSQNVEQKNRTLGHQPQLSGGASRKNKTEQQTNYDLARAPENHAKNSRSHNLSTKLNEHVNIASNMREGTNRPCQTAVIKQNGNMNDSGQIKLPPASGIKVDMMGNRTGKDDPQKSTEIYDKAHTCHSVDFVDGSNPGNHKPKRDENLQESSAAEQENIGWVARRNQHRLKDNDGYMGKYNRKEISKSDLSLSALEKRDRRRGMYFTDGEYIWGPFDTSPFEESPSAKKKRDYYGERILEKDKALSEDVTNSLNFHRRNLGTEEKLQRKYPVDQENDRQKSLSSHEGEIPGYEDENIERKLSDIQKSIAEDLQRIEKYMKTAEKALYDAERDLIETSSSTSSYILDTPRQISIKHILSKRPSPIPTGSTPIRQISHFSPMVSEVENMPETKHALVDLYNISRTLDTLNNLISSAQTEKARITQIDDGRDGPHLNSDDVIPHSSVSTSGGTSGAESDADIDKIIQSKNILSGYLITKQNQEQVLLRAGMDVFIPTEAENENSNVIPDLVNGKTSPPPEGAEGSNDPLKIDEKDSKIRDNGVHLTRKSDLHDDKHQLYGPEKSRPGRQLNSCQPGTKLAPCYDAAEGTSRDDTINKDNKFSSEQEVNTPRLNAARQPDQNKVNETIHRHELRSEYDTRVSYANPNTMTAIRLEKQQSFNEPQTGNEPAHFQDMKSSASGSGETAHDYHLRIDEQDTTMGHGHKEKFGCESSLSAGNYPESDYDNDTDESRRNEPCQTELNGKVRYGLYMLRCSSQPPPVAPSKSTSNENRTRRMPLVRQHSFDSSDSRYYGSPSLFMTGHFYPTEGYKRVAWPPASEGTPVKGSTPQPQQPQYQGGQNYYSQPTQPQYPQHYGGQSPQPQQHQQPAQFYQQQHQPRQESTLHQQPSYPERSHQQPDSYPQRESYGRQSNPSQERQYQPQSFRPIGQSSTVSFSGGVPQKRIPSLPGQPKYLPVQEDSYQSPQFLPQQQYSAQPQLSSQHQYSPQPQPQYSPQPQPQYSSQQQYSPQPQSQPQPQYSSQHQFSPQPQPQYTSQPQYNPQPQSPYLVSPSGQSAEPLSSQPPPKGWSHVPSSNLSYTGYTHGSPQYPSSTTQPSFGSQSHFGQNQPQSQQFNQTPVSHQPSYGQQQPQQQYSYPEQQYYSQGGQQQQQQFDRGQSPGVIQLRKEAPISQKPAPVVTSQPAAKQFRGGSNMRGDLKWPPPEVKAQMEAEEQQRRMLATGPAVRPRRVHKDYTPFFAKHALNSTYPGYKVPPGTQHMYVEF